MRRLPFCQTLTVGSHVALVEIGRGGVGVVVVVISSVEAADAGLEAVASTAAAAVEAERKNPRRVAHAFVVVSSFRLNDVDDVEGSAYRLHSLKRLALWLSTTTTLAPGRRDDEAMVNAWPDGTVKPRQMSTVARLFGCILVLFRTLHRFRFVLSSEIGIHKGVRSYCA